MINISPSGGDDTAAIRAALNTGQHVCLSEGTFNVTDSIPHKARGQIISGQGQRSTKIRIPPSFNKSAQGVFVFPDVATEIRDLWVAFDQPDTSSRASLINYPAAIYAVDRGFSLRDCSITQAMTGINMTGNTGQTSIKGLNMSAYGTGIMIDGAMDTIRIDEFHFWPFEMTGNQTSIFYTTPTKALSVGRVDGLFLSKFLSIANLGLEVFQGATGAPWIYLSECAFDTFNGIRMSAGSVQATNCYITLAGTPSLQGIMQTGGFLQLANCYLSSGQTQPLILLQNMSEGSLQIDNSYFNAPNCTQISVGGGMSGNSIQVSNTKFQGQGSGFRMATVAAPSGANNYLHCTNNILRTQPHVAYGSPLIEVLAGNRVHLSGNRVMDKGANPGTFIRIANDDFHWVSGNIAPGWGYGFPTARTGFYSSNL